MKRRGDSVTNLGLCLDGASGPKRLKMWVPNRRFAQTGTYLPKFHFIIWFNWQRGIGEIREQIKSLIPRLILELHLCTVFSQPTVRQEDNAPSIWKTTQKGSLPRYSCKIQSSVEYTSQSHAKLINQQTVSPNEDRIVANIKFNGSLRYVHPHFQLIGRRTGQTLQIPDSCVCIIIYRFHQLSFISLSVKT